MELKLVNDLLNTNAKYTGLRKHRLGEETEVGMQSYREFLKFLMSCNLIERSLSLLGVCEEWQVDKALEDLDLIPESFIDSVGNCICDVIDTNPDEYGALGEDGLYKLDYEECIDFLLNMELLIAKNFNDELEYLAEQVAKIKLPWEQKELDLVFVDDVDELEDDTQEVKQTFCLLMDDFVLDLKSIAYYMRISTPARVIKVADESDVFNCLMTAACLSKCGKLKKLNCDEKAFEAAKMFDFERFVELVQ